MFKATKNPNKKPVWQMSLEEQKDDKTVVFDYDELLEFAEGDIAPVFGPEFKIIDSYQRRVRLPAREYLLVTRVTKLDAVPNKFVSGATMTTEYDLPINGELSLGGDIPWAVLVESGQCDLMLISYMGIDFMNKSHRVYRLLDTTLTFFGVAQEGETLVYDIKVNGFAKGAHGDISMFFFEYNCYCNGKLLIEMRSGAAGFFSDEELAAGKGAVRTKVEQANREKLKQKAHENRSKVEKVMLQPCLEKKYFTESDMQQLVNKQWGSVLGPAYDLNYRLTTPKMLMIDRITHIDPFGGVHGQGLIVGEKILDRNHWYFPCHFVKDQVMAGSLVSDGCSQMMKVFMMWLGLNTLFDSDSIKFRPVNGQKNKVRCRGQISPHKGKLVYVMEIREIGYDEENLPYAIADVDIIDIDEEKGQTFNWQNKTDLLSKLDEYGRGDLNRKIVVDFKGIALKMQGVRRDTTKNHSMVHLPPKNCLKTDQSPPQEVVWHPYYDLMKKFSHTPKFTFYPSNFPPRAIAFLPFTKRNHSEGKVSNLSEVFNEIDLNFTPGQYPLNFYNMCEFMCGHVSNCLGKEFSLFDVSRTSRSPAFDLALVTRVIKWTDLVPKQAMGIDVDPSKGEMIAEFDCPSDAWFFNAYKDNTEAHLPYSIIMEIALQTSGILTSILKAPLTMQAKDILFRNLDATAEIMESFRGVDLRGKTIINHSKCTGYNMLGKMGIHRFTFELFIKDKEPEGAQKNLSEYINSYEANYIDNNKSGAFYKGKTSFGWFVPEVFENQVGLDNGKKTEPHFVKTNLQTECFSNIDKPSGKAKLLLPSTNLQEYRKTLFRNSSQAEYLDEINVNLSEKYVHGKKTVNTSDWFFSCHFWNDPVMPGSLGIESMIQLMEYYVIHAKSNVLEQLNIDKDSEIRFRNSCGETSWKYRGQLTTKNERMDSEIFVRSINVASDGRSIELVADGNLYVDNLRVYEAKNLRLEVYVCNSRKISSQIHRSTAEELDGKSLSIRELKTLLKADKTFYLKHAAGHPFVVTPVSMSHLGDNTFMKFYGVKANMYSGAMAKGIASADLVIAMGQNNLLGSFGAGGLPMHIVERSLIRIKEELGDKPFAVNLIHSPFDPNLEEGNINLFDKYGVTIAEASAFMALTPSVVLYRVRGLSLNGSTIFIKNKLIAKCSRTEVADQFLRPAPLKFLEKLLKQGKISQEQFEIAQYVPMADDITIEADSGGHTDNRQLQVILPLVLQQRNKVFKEVSDKLLQSGKTFSVVTKSWCPESNCTKDIPIKWPIFTRVGAGGGIGCPEAAVCAYSLGAAFLVTGTINQMCRESGTCDTVRKYLSEASYADVTMAPAADMFEQGVQLQVLKKGTMFPSRAKKLYDLFCKYDSFEQFPPNELANLERRILKKTLAQVWEETKDFYINRLHNQEKIDKVEVHGDQKLKMSLCFRWYLGLSSFWANSGDKDRKTDYQVWCGPAIGAFNEFIRGSSLDPKVSKVYPSVVDANLQLLEGATYLTRLNKLRFHKEALGLSHKFSSDLAIYYPR